MSDEEWAATKEQLEASISDDDEYLRETLSLLDTTPSPEGRAEFFCAWFSARLRRVVWGWRGRGPVRRRVSGALLRALRGRGAAWVRMT